jgi:hypothetical protein
MASKGTYLLAKTRGDHHVDKYPLLKIFPTFITKQMILPGT